MQSPLQQYRVQAFAEKLAASKASLDYVTLQAPDQVGCWRSLPNSPVGQPRLIWPTLAAQRYLKSSGAESVYRGRRDNRPAMNYVYAKKVLHQRQTRILTQQPCLISGLLAWFQDFSMASTGGTLGAPLDADTCTPQGLLSLQACREIEQCQISQFSRTSSQAVKTLMGMAEYSSPKKPAVVQAQKACCGAEAAVMQGN